MQPIIAEPGVRASGRGIISVLGRKDEGKMALRRTSIAVSAATHEVNAYGSDAAKTDAVTGDVAVAVASAAEEPALRPKTVGIRSNLGRPQRSVPVASDQEPELVPVIVAVSAAARAASLVVVPASHTASAPARRKSARLSMPTSVSGSENGGNSDDDNEGSGDDARAREPPLRSPRGGRTESENESEDDKSARRASVARSAGSARSNARPTAKRSTSMRSSARTRQNATATVSPSNAFAVARTSAAAAAAATAVAVNASDEGETLPTAPMVATVTAPTATASNQAALALAAPALAGSAPQDVVPRRTYEAKCRLVDATQRSLEAAQAATKHVEKRLKDCKAELNEVLKAREKVETKLDEATERVEELEAAAADAEVARKTVADRVIVLEAKIKQKDKLVESTQRDLGRREEQLKEQRDTANKYKDEAAQLRRQLAAATTAESAVAATKAAVAAANAAAVTEHAAALQALREELEYERAERASDASAAQAEIEALKQAADTHKAALEAVVAQHDAALEAAATKAANELKAARAEVQALVAQAQIQSQALASASSQTSPAASKTALVTAALQKQLEQSADEAARLQQELNAARADADKFSQIARDESATLFRIREQLIEAFGRVRVYLRLRPQSVNPTASRRTAGDGPRAEVVFVQPGRSSDGSELVTVQTRDQATQYALDRVLPASTSQQETYAAVHEFVQSSLNGCPVTILAYGMTGSGKTYTMVGDWSVPSGRALIASSANAGSDSASTHALSEQAGVMPRAVDAVFAELATRRARARSNMSGADAKPKEEYRLRVCAYQVYNNETYDLLDTQTGGWRDVLRRAAAAERPAMTPTALWAALAGAADAEDAKSELPDGVLYQIERTMSFATVPVTTPAQVEFLVTAAVRNRATAYTAANAASSRSHLVVKLFIDKIDYGNAAAVPAAAVAPARVTRRSSATATAPAPAAATASATAAEPVATPWSMLTLVDLAGSERLDKSQVDSSAGGDAGFHEMKSINLSLSTLGQCVKALVDIAGSAKEAKHVPFRDSRLTVSLRDSLYKPSTAASSDDTVSGPALRTGAAKVMFLLCASTDVEDAAESQATLQFAQALKPPGSARTFVPTYASVPALTLSTASAASTAESMPSPRIVPAVASSTSGVRGVSAAVTAATPAPAPLLRPSGHVPVSSRASTMRAAAGASSGRATYGTRPPMTATAVAGPVAARGLLPRAGPVTGAPAAGGSDVLRRSLIARSSAAPVKAGTR